MKIEFKSNKCTFEEVTPAECFKVNDDIYMKLAFYTPSEKYVEDESGNKYNCLNFGTTELEYIEPSAIVEPVDMKLVEE